MGWKFVYAASFFSCQNIHTQKAQGKCSISQSWCTLVTCQSSNSLAESSKSCLVFRRGNNVISWQVLPAFVEWNLLCIFLNQFNEIKCPIRGICLAQLEEVNWSSPNLLFAQHIENCKLKAYFVQDFDNMVASRFPSSMGSKMGHATRPFLGRPSPALQRPQIFQGELLLQCPNVTF